MNRRNLIKILAGTALSGNVIASQAKEKSHFNYLDIIGHQISGTDISPSNIFETPVFIHFKKLAHDDVYTICLDRANNIQTFSSKNDANKFVSDLIDVNKTEHPYDYSVNHCADLKMATLITNQNRMAVSNRRSPANIIVASPELYNGIIDAVNTNSLKAQLYGASILSFDEKVNTIQMFYKGDKKWDAPLSYKILPSGEIEVHISPAFDRLVRKVPVV